MTADGWDEAPFERCFTPDDQAAFAALSGDENPLHVDALAARRLLFGGPVVHGVALVLWALNAVLRHPSRLARLEVAFSAAVKVGARVTGRVVAHDHETLRLELISGGRITTTLTLTVFDSAPALADSGASIANERPPSAPCRVQEPGGLATASGTVALRVDRSACAVVFPGLAERLPVAQVAVLLATTRLVGMDCPGRHSLYAGLKLTFDPTNGPLLPNLDWRVQRFDGRLSYLEIAVAATGATGVVTAFLRPSPQSQPAFADLRCRVAPEIWRGRRALVIGGSRGLGEACAKLLAAGGAEVRLTYHQGGAEAEAVVAEIVQGGGRARACAWNVLEPPTDVVAHLGAGWWPSHLYYFATPPIFGNARKRFSPERFAGFCACYVTGLVATVQAVRALTRDRLWVFYPSSEAVDTVPLDLGDYAAAKAAGETTCRFLAATDPELTVLIERLPRLATDQTASLMPIKTVDTLAVLLKILETG